jgi:PAS domain S-box-containing protein
MGIIDQEKADRIKQLLKWHPRGMTITDISYRINQNRNLVAKYLDMLLISGQVEMQVIGTAKVYFLSHRVPISAMLEFSSDLLIVVDSDQRILQVNEQVLLTLGEKREALIGRQLNETGIPFIRNLTSSGTADNMRAENQTVTEYSSMIRNEERHFRVKQVPTALEDGSKGITYIIEDITPQKKYQEMLRISEARYRGIVQSSGEAIISKTPEGRIASWNPAAERLFIYRQEDVLGQPFRMLVPSEFQDDLDALLKRIGQGDRIQRHEMKMIRKDGAVMDVLITVSPIQGENDQIAGMSSIVRDITGEKQEQHLREYEDRYRTLVEDLNVGIYRSTADPRGRFVWGNTALLNILGYNSLTDLQGISVIDIFSEPEKRKELIEELYNSGFVKNRIIHLKKKDGRQISVSVTALAEFDGQKNLVFINGIVQDITGIMHATKEAPRPSESVDKTVLPGQ